MNFNDKTSPEKSINLSSHILNNLTDLKTSNDGISHSQSHSHSQSPPAVIRPNTSQSTSKHSKYKKEQAKLPPNIAPIDPKLYRVNIDDIKKKHGASDSDKQRWRDRREILKEKQLNASTNTTKTAETSIAQDKLLNKANTKQLPIGNISLQEEVTVTMNMNMNMNMNNNYSSNNLIKQSEIINESSEGRNSSENKKPKSSVSNTRDKQRRISKDRNLVVQSQDFSSKKSVQLQLPSIKTGDKKNISTNVLNKMKQNYQKGTSPIPSSAYLAKLSTHNVQSDVDKAHQVEYEYDGRKIIELNSQKHKDNKEALLDLKRCEYCLKRVKSPIVLKCNHELCIACAKEVKSLHEFIKGEKCFNEECSVNYIKCPQCSVKTSLNPDKACEFNEILRVNWVPLNASEIEENNNNVNICEICPASKFTRDFAEFECLNCDIIICYECKIRHLANARHQHHKLIQIHKLLQERLELTLCEKHREPLKLFCITENTPCCVICANYENLHEGHNVKSVRSVIDSSAIELASCIRECEGQISTFDVLINQMTYAKESLEDEQEHFLSKLTQTFERILAVVKNHEEQMKKEIRKVFNDKLKMLTRKLNNFTYLKSRYEYYRTLVCDRDIDILDRIKQIKKLNEKIHKLEDTGMFKYDFLNHKTPSASIQYRSLKPSVFVNDPSADFESLVHRFSFLPLTDKSLEVLRNVFQNSNIISNDHISTDLLLTFPKIKSGSLLYKISRDGPSPTMFHELCDNKGPTLLLVKTDTGHIFGGFNPISWISEYMYNECENAFLFSVTDGNFRKPMKCNVKKSLKRFAIKQNEKEYSPGFGEANNADLLIAFRNLKNSYSNLGNVYKCPKGFNPSEFLAGKAKDWNIIDVEVYAVEVMDDTEFYTMVLN